MKVLIVDDDALIRDGLKVLLELEDDIEVMGTAQNGQEAFDQCRNGRPDLVLMDIRMPIMDGVLGTKLIKDHWPDIKVVILTTFKDDEYIKEAVRSGAEGYILKNQTADSIIESLRTVGKGNSVFQKEVAGALSAMIGEDKKKSPGHTELTAKELAILQLVGEGMSNKEIAEKLYLSEGTTRNYVTGLLDKLQLRDRTQLAIYYLKHY
ncbi:Transcriptional regulatory protein LnrK [Paenibacillus plantiphilus]|uniref:Transcriptional regulatory protein LnrK n=1 Tax=Paenibacillus plantiphilus TaxID=2905650 RepID=A0ABN8G727_9BACL|nr:response regulator transcription factor [Paenibacillus plantiphilus]CAH1201922.1 Transcriptional regulatory protein LnrK [Paenibacillus plantiphilus]